jgi:filamentous hemagglutinin family protein
MPEHIGFAIEIHLGHLRWVGRVLSRAPDVVPLSGVSGSVRPMGQIDRRLAIEGTAGRTATSRASPGTRRWRRSAPLLMTAPVALLLSPAVGAQSLPGGGVVVRGAASIAQAGSHLEVTQTSGNAILNWNDFSIGAGRSVHFANGSGATLNRVTGALPSSIDGALSATGLLYLVNRNGVVVGPKGVINAAGFMATTLDIHDDDFMAGGGRRFFGDSRAGIVNLGSILADTGTVALVAHSVRNEGTIRAPRGTAELLAGQEVFLASADAPALLVSLGEGAVAGDAGATNTGLIEAAQARMQAADGNLYALAINQSGVIRATGASTRDGRIVLTADGGSVQQNGALSARNADGSGGSILVGGDYRGRNADIATAARTIVTADATLDASAGAGRGDGGRVIVWADQETSFAGRAAARGGQGGGDGGLVEVSGRRGLDFRPAAPLDLAAPQGRAGTVLLDPDEIEVVGTVSGAHQIAAATVQAGLASANYVLTTSNFDPASGNGNITLSSALSWSTANTLTLTSGNGIAINANVTGASGTLELYAGRWADPPPESGLPSVDGAATLAAAATIQVDTLRYGANADSLPTGYTLQTPAGTGLFQADGTLRAATLEAKLDGGSAGLVAENSHNAIGAFRTSGTGNLGYTSLVDGAGDLQVFLKSASATGTGVTIVTPGDLTLEAGSQLSYPGAASVRDVVLASTGGNVKNQAGSSVFGTNLRYLIYSGTDTGTAKDGLSGTEEYSRSYSGNPPTDYAGDTTSRFLYRQASGSPELTYRASDLTRLYGDANPTLTYTVSGLQHDDVLTDVVSGQPLLSTAATVRSGVGHYTVSISQGTLSSSSYRFLFAPGTLTVSAAPLTLTVGHMSRYYGDTNPTLSASVSGLKAGDSAADIMAGWQLSTSATRASGVGDYEVAATWLGTGSSNYAYTVNNGTLTVKPTPVTLTLAPTSMRYGDALPDLRAAATLSGTYNGDSVASAFPAGTFSTAAGPRAAVGSYAVSASGFSNPNYLLTIGSLGDLTIRKAPLVVNANDASRLYGDANPAFTVASVIGWRNGDTISSMSDLALTSGATAGSSVGSYAIVPTGSATNYEFVAGTGTLTVTKAPLVVRLNAASRYYGDDDPAFTASYEGLKNGETDLPGLLVSSDATARSPVGTGYRLTAAAPSVQNYSLTFFGAALTVLPRPLAVTVNAAARPYGGANPAFTVSVDNATPWDRAQASAYWIAGSTATAQSNAGSYAITASVNPYGDRFDNLGNYAVTLNPGTLTITRAPLTVVATPVSILWGDGLPPLAYSVSGLMPWDSTETAGKVQLTSAAGGTKAAPGLYAIALASDLVGSNYQAVLSGSPMVQVERRPITLIGDYSSTMADLKQPHAGQIAPFLVKQYDSDGRLMEFSRTTPLPGGPQFAVMTSTDGTSGGALGSYVSTPFITTAAGTSLDEVLRYYDPVSKPGIALATTLTTNDNILQRDAPLPAPAVVVVDKPTAPTPDRPWTPGQPPSVARLIDEVAPGADDLRSLYADFRGSPAFTLMPSDALQLLRDTERNESAVAQLQDWITDSQARVDALRLARQPENWQLMVASAEADIARWRAQIDANPGLEQLRQRADAGDPLAMAALMPMLSAGMMKALQDGTLSATAQAALLENINGQRAELTAKVDANYDAYVRKQEVRQGSLTTVLSGTKAPDLVGSAYVDLAAERNANINKAILGGAVATGTYGILATSVILTSVLTIAGSTQSVMVAGSSAGLVANFGIAGGVAGGVSAIGAGAAFAIAVGVAEGVQVIESEKNLQRYQSFKAANQQLDSLGALDLKNKDNLAQAAMAIQALLAQTAGHAATSASPAKGT